MEKETKDQKAERLHALPPEEIRQKAEELEARLRVEPMRQKVFTNGYEVMESLGVVPFHDLHFERIPANQRRYPRLCSALNSFMAARAEYHRGGPSSTAETLLDLTGITSIFKKIDDATTPTLPHELGLQSRPRFIETCADPPRVLTISPDGLRLTVESKKANAEEAKFQQWVFSSYGFLENLALEKVLDFDASKVDETTEGIMELFLSQPTKDLSSQRWSFEKDRIRSAINEGKKHLVLDVDQASPDEGAPVILWREQTLNRAGNQRWRLLE